LGWTQQLTAQRLGVSQPYYSQLENGSRPIPRKLSGVLQRVLNLSPSLVVLPPLSAAVPAVSPRELAEGLGSLGYPGFVHLKATKAIPLNPAQLVVCALANDDLDPRLVEGLPWLLSQYADLDWTWLIGQCCVLNLQNRLGYMVVLAQGYGRTESAVPLTLARLALERSRLASEDTLCRSSMPEAERKWVRKWRPPHATHWNLLTTMTVED